MRLNNDNITASLRVLSVSGDDDFDINNLPSPDTLSDEDMEANFQKIMDSDNTEDEDSSVSSDSFSESNEEENNEEEESVLEQSNDSDSEDEEDLDEGEDESDDNTEDENSNEDENDNDDDNTENSEDDDANADDSSLDAEFSFDGIPMDETLPFEINAAGSKVKATLNELISGFQKGMGYTQSMQQIAPFRRAVGMMEDNGLTESDLNLLIELKSGNKDAIAKVLADSKVDALDLETEGAENHTPKDYGKDIVDPEMEQVKTTIGQSEHKNSVSNALNTMPIDFYTEIESSPKMLDNLYKDIADGTYADVMPEVQKLQTLYGKTKPTKELYVEVARRFADSKATKDSEEQDSSKENKNKKIEESKEKRRNASSGTKRKGQKSNNSVTKRIEEMGEDEFTKNFEKMTGLSAEQFQNY